MYCLYKKNPSDQIQRLASFLNMKIDDEQLKSLIEFTSFNNMKSLSDIAFNFSVVDTVFSKSINFFRKGQVGNWKEHLTNEMSKEIEEIANSKVEYEKQFRYELN